VLEKSYKTQEKTLRGEGLLLTTSAETDQVWVLGVQERGEEFIVTQLWSKFTNIFDSANNPIGVSAIRFTWWYY